MVWNWLRRHPVLVDALLTLAVGAIYVADAVYHHRYVLGLALALIQAAALLVRSKYRSPGWTQRPLARAKKTTRTR